MCPAVGTHGPGGHSVSTPSTPTCMRLSLTNTVISGYQRNLSKFYFPSLEVVELSFSFIYGISKEFSCDQLTIMLFDLSGLLLDGKVMITL